MSPAAWLLQPERSLAEDPRTENLAVALAVLASVAGENVPVDEQEVRSARVRLFSSSPLTATQKPARPRWSRGLPLSRTTCARSTAKLALESGFRDLRVQARGLPHVSEAVHGLLGAPAAAWRAHAAALLAEGLGRDE